MSDLNMPGTRKVCRIQFRFDNGTLTFTYMLLSEYKKKSTSAKELVTTNAQECSKSKATQNRNPVLICSISCLILCNAILSMRSKSNNIIACMNYTLIFTIDSNKTYYTSIY